MVQCEMCGTETAQPKTVKIEGAELDVCGECADFGTEVRTEQSSSTSTKYSTSSSSGASGGQSGAQSSTSSGSTGSSGTSGSSSRGRDMFDDVDDVAQDYDQRIRQAREQAGLSQEALANQLNEKASLIRKLEHGDVLPSDRIQRKLEGALDISLSAGGEEAEETEWEGGSSTGEYTLGDVVKRKD